MERVEVPEVPVEAVREIIVNSFAHMKVNNSSFNEMYITPTKIHIYNPGFLVKGKSPEDFASGKEGPIARNPLINTVLYLNKTIESFGTGFSRVFHICERNNVKYTYGNTEFGFYFEFARSPYDAVNESIDPVVRLSETETEILNLIRTVPGIRKSVMVERVGKSPATVQRAIKKLTDANLIEREGSNKNGYWRALK